MEKLGCSLVLIFVLMSSFVFAGISLSEPLSVYNLGDKMYVSVDGLRGADIGNLNIDLACGNRTTNLVKIPARAFAVDEDQSYSIPYKILNREDLEIANLSEILGGCQIIASLGSSVASTEMFDISKDVAVTASVDKASYNPGEAVRVDIVATKANGNFLNGFVEGSNISDFSKVIDDSSVSEIFSLPETIEAGNYNLNIRAYDVDADGILNEGSTAVYFDINQVVSSIIISLSDVEAVPGENFTVGVEVFDQSGVEMEGVVSMKIISPEGNVIESTVQSGKFGVFDFVSNSSVGMWKVVALFDNAIEEKEFEMIGVQKVEFEFEDSVLSVRNIGNVLYNKTISVYIGNETLELELKIDVGDIRKFSVKAPNGEHIFSADDGENSISKQVLLTGDVVSVNDLKNVGIFKEYSIVWIFLIIVLGGAGAVFFMKYRKTKTVGEVGIIKKIIGKIKGKFPVIKSSKNLEENYNHKNKNMVDLTKENVGKAEASLVLKGEKYLSAVAVLGIKNYENLGEVAKKNLRDAVMQKNKGVVDWRGDYVYTIFSPIITKTYNNEILAVKAGMEVLNSLNAHNKRFKDKVEFSIGVHVGELIASKVGDKLKYTSAGNTVSLAKRIADSDSGKLIVSDAIRKKLLRDLRVLKGKEIGKNLTYDVVEVKNRAGDAARLQDLMKRMG